MSNKRRARRQRPPASVQVALKAARCPDCDSVVRPRFERRSGQWHIDIHHDDECPQLRWRQGHGATRSYVLAAGDGRTVPASLVLEAAQTLGRQPGVEGVRVGTEMGLSWQEREAIDHQYDRFAAANAQVRQMLEIQFGPRPSAKVPPWASAVLDRFSTPGTPRCEHLVDDPAQPWLLQTGLGRWNCRGCVLLQAEKLKAGLIKLDPAEEHTCDRCRQQLGPGEEFTPLVLRESLWAIFGGVCFTCAAQAEAERGNSE